MKGLIMRKFGFKIFSTNLQNAPEFVKECADYAAVQNDMFVELMVLTGRPQSELYELKKILKDVEVRIHTVHSSFGFDVGNKNLEKQNKEMFEYTQFAADLFNSKSIVVHAGNGHGQEYLEETARQIKLFNDKRIVVENLPYFDDNGDDLSGSNADEIKYIMDKTGCGFCFDFSHAVCTATQLNTDIDAQLQSLFDLNPTVYHMCDGDLNQTQDLHLHFGSGNFPLKHFLNDFTAENAYITIETGELALHNDLSIKDYEYLKSLQD